MSDSSTPAEQPFISHLIELRDRLIRMVVAILVVFLVLFPFGNDIYIFVADPLMKVLPEGTSMIATQVASPFLTPFKLALVAAIFITMPYLLHQFWGFVAPGLYQHEKRLAVPLLASSVVLFYLGAAFAYFVVFPLVFAFLSSVTPEGVAMMTDISHYLDFVLTLFFAFGMAFEVPIATIVLVVAGVTTPESLAAKRPYVIVGAFVLGMLLTPPDIISQTLLALPMWLLFELGLVLSRMIIASRGEQRDHADDDAEDDEAFRPLAPAEMDDEFARIEAEFDALEPTDGPASGSSTRQWSRADAADMLDEEDFPARSATEALVDAKLEQVSALRATQAYDEARRLLYEVLSEGNADQVRTARNILQQLDS